MCQSNTTKLYYQIYRCTVHFAESLDWYTNQCTHIKFFILKLLDLQIPFVHTVFHVHIRKHRNTLESHPNPLVEPILHSEHNRRLKRS